MTDEVSLFGAMMQVKYCQVIYLNILSIGLEGGVMLINEELYLCNWGVLITPNKQIYKASGARINLPNEFMKDLNEGVELSELVDQIGRATCRERVVNVCWSV